MSTKWGEGLRGGGGGVSLYQYLRWQVDFEMGGVEEVGVRVGDGGGHLKPICVSEWLTGGTENCFCRFQIKQNKTL